MVAMNMRMRPLKTVSRVCDSNPREQAVSEKHSRARQGVNDSSTAQNLEDARVVLGMPPLAGLQGCQRAQPSKEQSRRSVPTLDKRLSSLLNVRRSPRRVPVCSTRVR
jgi:hypothetical protein